MEKKDISKLAKNYIIVVFELCFFLLIYYICIRCESGLHSAYSEEFVSDCVCTFLACIENTIKFWWYEITTSVALGRSQKGLGIDQEAFYRYARSGFGLYGFIVGHQLAQRSWYNYVSLLDFVFSESGFVCVGQCGIR